MQRNNHFDILLTWPCDGLRLFESMIPLGLASLAAVLRNEGYSVRIIDFNRYRSDFRLELSEMKPCLIGIGGTTQTRKSSFLTAKIAKEVLPSVPIVYGGPHATFAWKDTLEHVPEIDFVIRGEGEFSLLKLARKLVSKEAIDLSSIPGIAFRDNGQIKAIPPERINDLSILPMPARDLFEHKYPMKIDHTDYIADFIITSRGCPVTCDFCSATRLFPGGVRLRPISAVKEELEWICARNPSVQGVKVFDSTFTANREHVLSFCNLMTELKLKWECELRVDTVDYELLKVMRESGCVLVSIGAETTNDSILKNIGKKITKKQIEQVLQWCKDLSIITKVFFTFGHFNQSFKECLEDVAYLRKHRSYIDFFATTIGIRVYPGTVLEHKMIKHGIIPDKFSWVKYRAPIKNYWVMEPADVMILERPHLKLYKLSIILFLLIAQGTALSPKYLLKMVPLNISILYNGLYMKTLYTIHRIRRLFVYKPPNIKQESAGHYRLISNTPPESIE